MGKTPRLTVRCEYPVTDMPPTEVTFRLSPSYGLTTGHEVNEWFIDMMYDYEEFEVETDRPGELPLSFGARRYGGGGGVTRPTYGEISARNHRDPVEADTGTFQYM